MEFRGSCTDLRRADFTEASLQGADFDHAKLQGSRFVRSMMQGTSLADANLTASHLSYARLEGAFLAGAKAVAVSFLETHAQGADFRKADLTASSLTMAQLQGGHFQGANFNNTTLFSVNLYRAFIDVAALKTAELSRVHTHDRFPNLRRRPGRTVLPPVATQGTPDSIDAAGFVQLSARALGGVTGNTRDLILARLQGLDPSTPPTDEQLVGEPPKNSGEDEVKQTRRAKSVKIAEIMCDAADAPFVARGLIFNGRIFNAEMGGGEVIAKLRDTRNCPGARSLNASDLREIRQIEARVNNMRRRQQQAKEPQDPSSDDKD